ncbi:MAG: nucleotide-binding protein, PIN domain-containing protein [Saprospiraceae bacterium]|nr:MAG: nucleotide-binding protein, PIN domain-containing protein [Saprospiraceae bacterium]
MEKIIVDSSIVFASLISPGSKIRWALLGDKYQWYCPNFMAFEIFKHKEKLLKNKNTTEEDLYNCYEKILQKVHFVNESLIAVEHFIDAWHLCKEIDPKDTPFVALALELGCKIWSKDEELVKGLKAKGFDRFLEEDEL